jgi:aminopeptidase N
VTDSPHSSLQHAEAVARFDLLDVTSYDVALDLASDDATFGSVTGIAFRSHGGPTFVDLKPARVNEIRLNGAVLDPELLDRGRLAIDTVAGDNELVVDAVMRFRNDGEGLHRAVDPADGRHYVYGMSFMDAAPSIFACFDQPDLKAPYTFHVRAPRDWTVIGNAPGRQVEPGTWELEETRPLSTYFVTLVAGPYHVIHEEHDGIPLGLSSRQSIAKDLEADADELLTITRQCFDEFHRLFGIRYPFGDYHQAFVPEFNAGAMENPGCVTFRDPLVFTSQVTRGARIVRATTVAHEMAHQWFGNITTPKWWDDLWLNESFAEYLGNRVTADVTKYGDSWVHTSYARRQWGLVADAGPATHPVAGNGAEDAVSALQDFDGISYAKGSSILKQLNGRMGDDIFLAGLVDHFETHRFGNATMHDLFASWERAGAGDLSDVTGAWLGTAGLDTVCFDRGQRTLRRTPPVDHPTERVHTFGVSHADATGTWQTEIVTLGSEGVALPTVAADAAVVIDAHDDSWLLARPDETSLRRFVELAPTIEDQQLRAGIWNNVRSGFERGHVDPALVIDLACAVIPTETGDAPLAFNSWAGSATKMQLMEWLVAKAARLTTDPDVALDHLHAGCLSRARSAAHGSTLQLAAFQGATSSCRDAGLLVRWLDGDPPEGVTLDLDLRWRVLVQLAALGAVSRDDLDDHLAAEPTARSRVDHARATAALPDPETKEWAWRRFLAEEDVPNYELQATGQGMWQAGQEELTAPYVDRYFADLPGTASRRSGWVLADAAEWFFPLTALSSRTVDQALALAGNDDLDLSLRRRAAVTADEMRRRLVIVERYSRA